jgi:UDP-glucuronate 4-epimerase
LIVGKNGEPRDGNPVTYLVTGAAGFIGYHLTQALLGRGERVVGLDNLNPYYDVRLKEARLAGIKPQHRFLFHKIDIADRDRVFEIINANPDIHTILHLGAQAGVRHSLIDPYSYVHSNLMGQVVILEAARLLPRLAHFIYASSSSVYGRNTKQPFSVEDRTDHPISFYAATKKADELMAESYSWIYRIPVTGLRFFTVYGPWGRPDMAYYSFSQAIVSGKPIRVFNYGKARRDFTYIDDIVAGVLAAAECRPPDNPGTSMHRVYNLGHNRPEQLLDLITILEREFGREAEKILEPLPPGDLVETCADITSSQQDFGYDPTTSLSEGLHRFVQWFKSYHGIES